MNPFKLFDPSYLFALSPGYNYIYHWPLFIFFVLFFLASFKASTLIKERENAKLEAKYFGGIPNAMRWIAILGLIFNFFRDQNIPFFGMRVFMLLILLAIPVYAIYVWRKYELKFEEDLNKKAHAPAMDPYLPKKKNRRKKKS